ncbi:hypothetical protein ON010_g17412 [Phytophthora cinnamomi]|nr:hypothetical protein ON010_g17412 [Phytophthora cinnamomi]
MLRKEPRARPSVNQLIRRPLVLARIQSFLSARALASELNHTVLHGENVFRKKTSVEDKSLLIAPSAQHVRRAEPVVRTPALNAAITPSSRQAQQNIRKPLSPHARNGKARVGSVLGASRKARGLPNGALRRSRPIQKRVQPDRVPARISSVSNLNAPKKRVVPARSKGLESLASAQVKAKLKAQMKAKENAAAAAVAALPDPPIPSSASKTDDKGRAKDNSPSGIAERVAAFNAKWAAQKEQLVKNLPPPPPTAIAKNVEVSKKPKPNARAYPRPVVLGVQGKAPNSSKRTPPPAPIGIRRQQPKQKTPGSAPKTRGPAVRDSQPSLREHRLEFQRKRQTEISNADGKPCPAKASPLDDPIILVQQLPDFKTPPTQESAEQVVVQPPPVPATLTSSLPEFADKKAELASDSAHNEIEEEDHELTSLPPMANLEFERMVLQLKSAVELDMTSSDDEDDGEDEQTGEQFVPEAPPPPYSPPATFSLDKLDISVLEDAEFRLALQKRLQVKIKSNATGQVQVDCADHLIVDANQQAVLNWMHNYISSLL